MFVRQRACDLPYQKSEESETKDLQKCIHVDTPESAPNYNSSPDLL